MLDLQLPFPLKKEPLNIICCRAVNIVSAGDFPADMAGFSGFHKLCHPALLRVQMSMEWYCHATLLVEA